MLSQRAETQPPSPSVLVVPLSFMRSRAVQSLSFVKGRWKGLLCCRTVLLRVLTFVLGVDVDLIQIWLFIWTDICVYRVVLRSGNVARGSKQEGWDEEMGSGR